MNWSYARQVRARLSQQPLPTDCACLAAEWWGMKGQWLAGRAQAPSLAVASAAVARRAYRLMRALGMEPRLDIDRRRRLPFRIVGRHLPPLDPLRAAEACPHGFLLGAFLAHGSLTDPDRSSHLEVWVPNADEGRVLAAVLARWRIRGKWVPRRGGYALYLKGRRAIIRFLTVVGAHEAVLKLENLEALRAMRNRINRLVNSETANLHRAVVSGLDQANLLQRLRESPEWEELPEGVRAVATLRIQHPDWSLREIGLALDPPRSKSAVNHRMRQALRRALDSGQPSVGTITRGSESDPP
ncbi:MAG: DNA-binding protein WhiA [Firmicutes bacterium]|nr:DNA-binding protein WhiA [Alicyclobacillaceae bacterium]MCL6497508.1 DNA-binding protein WhiA [Bacillota bacterium]